MADEGKLCVCPQCGKKYKLKEGFDAKSFSCKSCGATVWIEGKPTAPAPVPRRATATAVRPGRGARAGGRGAHRHARGHGGEAGEAEGHRGRRHEEPKSKTNLLLAIAAFALIGALVVFFAVSGGKEEKKPPEVAQQPAGAAPAPPPTQQPVAPAPSGGAPAAPSPTPGNPEQPGAQPGEEPEPEPGEEPKPKLGDGASKRKPADGKSRYDPPATLGHLETTPPETRKQIDEMVAILLDPAAGKEVHEAKTKLAAIGKPAFLPILGAMAKIRDTITDNDSFDERRIESALMLADQCLREMDGYLDSYSKQPIRPGTDKKYLEYILRMHYKRWETTLKDMPEMPGAFDPTKAPAQPGEGEEEE